MTDYNEADAQADIDSIFEEIFGGAKPNDPLTVDGEITPTGEAFLKLTEEVLDELINQTVMSNLLQIIGDEEGARAKATEVAQTIYGLVESTGPEGATVLIGGLIARIVRTIGEAKE